MTEKEFTPTKFVVAGRTHTTVPGKGKGKGKRVVGTILRRVNDDETTLDAEDRVYGSKDLRHKNVGGVYLIDAEEGGTRIIASTARFVGRWHDGEAVLGWQLQAQAFELELTSSKRERDDKALPAALEHLRPLLLIYNRTNWQGRMSLELIVLNYLRTGGGKFNLDDE